MPRTFMQMVADAQSAVEAVGSQELSRAREADDSPLVIDVRDESAIRSTGLISGAAMISAGSLLFRADNEVPEEWRDARLADRSRAIVTYCDLGPLSAIAAKNLQDMGFENVRYLEGGISAWKAEGCPTEDVA